MRWCGVACLGAALVLASLAAAPVRAETERERLERLAAGGDARAMVELGHRFYDGRGWAQDYGQARHWYEKAAAAGNTGAMYDLGYLYDHGRGVPRDYAQARSWYEKIRSRRPRASDEKPGPSLLLRTRCAAGLCRSAPLVREGRCRRRRRGDERPGRALLQGRRRAAGLRAGAPLVREGRRRWRCWCDDQPRILYAKGRGVRQDFVEARLWYQKAAAGGDLLGMHDLGFLYHTGQGVRRDYQQARYWYEKAAAAGNNISMENLGSLYHNGQGVRRDYRQARYWYERAIAAGTDEARQNLARLDRSRSARRAGPPATAAADPATPTILRRGALLFAPTGQPATPAAERLEPRSGWKAATS